jgi:hypothetical protein
MTCRFNRSAIMKDAHRRFREANDIGLPMSFSRALQIAWYAAKYRRDNPRQYYNPDRRARDILRL